MQNYAIHLTTEAQSLAACKTLAWLCQIPAIHKCVQREAVLRTAERFGVQTHYYRLPMWPVTWVTKKMWWSNKRLVVRCLSWKTISVPWFDRDCWHGGRADNSNKTANNAKYSNCKGLNHGAYDVSLKNLRSRPFWILSSLRILFLSILRLHLRSSMGDIKSWSIPIMWQFPELFLMFLPMTSHK